MSTTIVPPGPDPGIRMAIHWYRTPVDRDLLARLNARSDLRGLLQAGGHLGILAVTATLALFALGAWPWWAVLVLLFLHGTVASFCINAMHELVHRSVFRTQALNALFVRIFSFIGWLNFEHFFASHMRHHQYTLHPPEDGEVILPIRIIRWQFVRSAVVNIHGGIETVRPILQQAAGRFEGAWNERLFPADQADKRLPVTRWARALLAGHAILAAVSILEGWWLVPVVVSLTPWYGGWLFFLCNNTQHVGLQDRVPDFRMCCRTFMVNPLVQFLYWHMNFHTEHHMYAAVPCYHLAGLHRAIRYDLPHCSRGLRATWTEIAAILRRQQEDPGYQYAAPLPPTAAPARTQGYPPSIP